MPHAPHSVCMWCCPGWHHTDMPASFASQPCIVFVFCSSGDSCDCRCNCRCIYIHVNGELRCLSDVCAQRSAVKTQDQHASNTLPCQDSAFQRSQDIQVIFSALIWQVPAWWNMPACTRGHEQFHQAGRIRNRKGCPLAHTRM